MANQEPYFFSDDVTQNYAALPGVDVNFNFSGTVVTNTGTPEPTTLLLMAPALLLVLRRRLTR